MKTLHWLDENFEDVICGLLLTVIMIFLFAQVVVRFLFGSGLAVAEEVSRLSFLFLVYFGSSLAAAKGAHIRVTAQLRFLPRVLGMACLLTADLLWLSFNGVVIWQGCMLVENMATRPMLSGVLLIDLRPVFAMVPLAFALQSFRIVQHWFRYFRGRAQLPLEEEA